MKEATSHYAARFVVFLAILATLILVWDHFNPHLRLPAVWGIYALLALVSFGSHVFILGAEEKRPQVFVHRFIATTTTRLFLFIIVLAGYCFLFPDQAVRFILYFFVLYLIFTAYEVATLYRHFSGH